MQLNPFNQTIGDALADFTPGAIPQVEVLEDQTVLVEKLTEKHLDDLYEVYEPTSPLQNWTYLPIEPFTDKDSFTSYFQQMVASKDPLHFAIVDKTSKKALGTVALMRIDTQNRVLEMGWVVYSTTLQRSRQATEVQYLLMKYVFEDLGYRRYEWKCDSLNQPSHNAALRLGFTYEGSLRQAAVYKGRNRDTNWFSILDKEWPTNKKRLEDWLTAENIDENGLQKTRLSTIN